MKSLVVFLFVAHLSPNGWVEAPRHEFTTMSECRTAEKEMKRGFRLDDIQEDEYVVKCTRNPNFDYRTEIKK